MDVLFTFLESLKESIVITLIIFVLMVMVELLVLKYKSKLVGFLTKNKLTGYITSSLFGSLPGCVGTYAMDTLYMAGLLGFGGLAAALISTSGDEAFLLVSLTIAGKISWNTLLSLVVILFVLGILGGYLADYLMKKFGVKICEKCKVKYHKGHEFDLKHFVKKHITEHIIKKHILQIFIWIFIAVFTISTVGEFIDYETILTGYYPLMLLVLGALVGLLPLSGPNVFLIIMFSQGLVPFSVVLANSIVQDGHGLLPILGFSVSDAIKLKVYNFLFGLTVGLIVFGLGF